MIVKLFHKILDLPLVFHYQQKICNNYKNVLNEFSDYLLVKDKKIIEIGCSTGICANEIINMRHNEYFGIDIEKKYIEKARSLFPNGQFICQDARNLKFDDGFFDIAIFNGVAHHMSDVLFKDCLKEIKRVIKNNGFVLISEPVFNHKNILSTILLSVDRGKYIRKSEEYSRLIIESGFKIIRTRFFKFSAHRFVSYVSKK